MRLIIVSWTLLFFIPLVLMSQSPKTSSGKLPQTIYLWPEGAPGFENRKNEPEQSKDWWVKNIHNPSITAYFPAKGKSNGAAVLICPGGGHGLLVINAEGTEPAQYLASLGVTAFVLKYRLAREENSTYSLDNAKEDAYRAMRLIRSHAKEWNLDSTRIGMLGFSAGGELVSMLSYSSGKGNPDAEDAIDRFSGKPDFQLLIYPGPLGIPEVVPKDAPPLFMLAANDDKCCSGPVVELLKKYREAGISVEAHIYAQGDHAFNMGKRSDLNSIKTWPQRMADWLSDNRILTQKKR